MRLHIATSPPQERHPLATSSHPPSDQAHSMDPRFQQAHAASPWSEPRGDHYGGLSATESALWDDGLYGTATYSHYEDTETNREQSSYLLTPPASISGSYQPPPRMPTISTASSIYPFQQLSTPSPPALFSPNFWEVTTARPTETQAASQGVGPSPGRPHGGPRCRAIHNLTIAVPEGPVAVDSDFSFGGVPTLTSEPSSSSATSQLEMNQYLSDMNQILGLETMASLSSPPTHSYPQSPFSPHQTATSQFPSGVYSDVYGNAEDHSVFTRSSPPPYPFPTLYEFPRSAPAYRTTFDESIFRPLPAQSTFYPLSSLPLYSPRSSDSPSPTLSFRHRRGSSLDAELRGSQSHAASYSYPSHLVSPVVRNRATPYTAPRRTAAPSRKPAVAPKGGFAFINYGVGDANALLDGVAPSGSSKRKREEAEEAEREKVRARQRV